LLINIAFELQQPSNTQGGGSIRVWTKKDPAEAVREGLLDCYPRLWRFCIAQTGQRTTGDDLAQATCLRALEKAQQFTPGTHLDRWLFVMARRIWLNELREQSTRKTEAFGATGLEELASNIPTSETNILAREVFDKVAALPEAQRVTALLVFVEGYTYAETAEALDVPIGTVMSRVSAARKALLRQTGQAKGAK